MILRPVCSRRMTASPRRAVSDARSDRATQERLGEVELVELVAPVGHYGLIAPLMNTFQIPLPPGEQYVWSR
jgi:alkylhydroperoxidase family enzyme